MKSHLEEGQNPLATPQRLGEDPVGYRMGNSPREDSSTDTTGDDGMLVDDPEEITPAGVHPTATDPSDVFEPMTLEVEALYTTILTTAQNPHTPFGFDEIAEDTPSAPLEHPELNLSAALRQYSFPTSPDATSIAYLLGHYSFIGGYPTHILGYWHNHNGDDHDQPPAASA